jgi:hypothetical protein
MEKEQSCFIREKKEKNFTVMSNYHLRSEKLSWKAKGVFSYLLSLPDDWVIYLSELKKHATDGRDSLRTAIKELEENGFISKKRIKDELNRFCGYRYTIHETPIKTSSTADFPYTDFPSTAFPSTENPTLLNTNSLLNTNNKKDLLYTKEVVENSNETKELFTDTPVKEKTTKNKYSEDFERFWNEYPKKAGKEYSLKSFNKLLKEGLTIEIILLRLNTYKEKIKKLKTDYEYIRNPKTFLDNIDDYNEHSPQQKTTSDFRPAAKKEKKCPLCGGVLKGSACSQCYANFDSEGREI